jgi:hypothetical protein
MKEDNTCNDTNYIYTDSRDPGGEKRDNYVQSTVIAVNYSALNNKWWKFKSVHGSDSDQL